MTSGLQFESHYFELILIAQCADGLGSVRVDEQTSPWLMKDGGVQACARYCQD